MHEDKPEYLSKRDRKPPKPPNEVGIGTAGFGDDNNRRKKEPNDAKRGAALVKVIRSITSAVKHGGGNPNSNSLLKSAIERVKSLNVPTSIMERAIIKRTGQ